MTERQTQPPHTVSLVRFWGRHSWLVIGLLWIAALILGYVGFALDASGAGRPIRFFDIAYRTLQLIPMNSGDVGGANWQLNAARFLIPFLAAWTAVRALLSLFRDRWQQVLVRFWRDHVIICGLSRKGWLLAQGFVARGDRVVVIEADESHDLIGPCRERGIVVLVGSATEPDLLRRAGLQRASHLVAVTDDDGVNVDIAVRAQGLLRTAVQAGRRSAGRDYPLTCTVHLVDPQLHELARAREMALEEGVPLRLEMFNVFDRAARLLWSQFRPSPEDEAPSVPGEPGAGTAVHVLVIGLGSLGESLVVYAARDWHTRLHESPRRVSGRLRITVVDQDADWKCRALGLRYPRLAGVCDLIPLTTNVDWPQFYEGAFLAGSADVPPVGAVFVCFDDDSLALRTGLLVHQRLLHGAAGSTPVIVRMAEAGGLARLAEADGVGAAFANLEAFGLLDRTCTPEAILGGTHEVLARWLHLVYRQQQQALGHTAATNPSLVDWDQLPEALRKSSRAEADGIFRHLTTLGYTLVPLVDWDAAFFHFSEAELVRLAKSEHGRFVAERLGEGWQYTAGSKDVESRRSPALAPWEKLSEDERAKTRNTIRELPVTLARAGFQIVRLPSTEQTDATPTAQEEGPVSTETGRREIMARAVHERYRASQREIKPPDDPAMQPWETLAEHLRESNRQQADGIGVILRSIGCAMRPASGDAPAPFHFTDEEVEIMAGVAREHWVAERRRAGWVSGPERDLVRKITPYLEASYAELPEDVKEWDRQAVRAIPEVLAAAGYEVYRLG
jgi:hypothetical protein